ncbi:hypothetical protein HerbRD11066_75810 [Herbidospora sp. RD11066]
MVGACVTRANHIDAAIPGTVATQVPWERLVLMEAPIPGTEATRKACSPGAPPGVGVAWVRASGRRFIWGCQIGGFVGEAMVISLSWR